MPSAQQQQAMRTAWSQWNPNNYQAGLSKEMVDGIVNQGWRTSPDADYSGSVSQFGLEGGTGPNDPQRIVYHPQGQGPGEAYYTFDPTTGKYLSNETGSKVQSYASGILSVAAAGLGAELAFGGLGAAGTSGYATGGLAGGGGAGVGAGGGTAVGAGTGGGVTGFGDAGTMYGGGTTADGLSGASSLGGGGSFTGAGMDATYGAAGAGGTTAMGAGAGGGAGGAGGGAGGSTGGSFWNAVKGGASSLFGGGGAGTMDWTSLISPALQALGGFASSNAQKDAANTAANAQTNAAQLGINEQQREFDQVRGLLGPYVQAGYGSLKQQQDLAGANGPEAQQAAISALQQTPGFQSQLKLGENRILQNASATGGLRGGNTEGALAYFSPTLLAQTINDQYGRLGGLTSLGQNAAVGVGNAGMQTGQGVSGLMQQQGSAAAGAALANGKAQTNLYSSLLGSLGQYFGAKGGMSTGGGGGGGGSGGGASMPDAVNMGTATGADAALFW